MIEQNKIYNADCLEIARQLPDGCVDLLIADPPYFEVKGAFDFVWPSFEAYLADVEKWAAEFSRILSPQGTLFWYGHALKIAYAQIIFDKHLTLLNSLVWEKTQCQQRRNDPEQSRRFAPVTERILMYAHSDDISGTTGMLLHGDFGKLMNYFADQKKHTGLSSAQLDDIMGIKSSFCYWEKPSTHPYRIPDEKNYLKLQATGFFQREYEDLRREYEDLRREYEDLRRPFNNETLLTDVLKFSQESHITRNYEHDTKKPETLTRALILTCSRKNDLVFVPFAGSGTECAMAAREGRRYIGCEIDPKHWKTATARTDLERRQTRLF